MSPAWILVAWTVVATASFWKFWRITGAYRRKLGAAAPPSVSDRERLERSWRRSEP
ncbi:hypothetical protein KR49_00905 [Synechococcus sp. KORDI-49]|uniref:hypothetical protein n=1 Tax=Synechococcales TaxID=1890424 RepID=UPI0004E06B30|nr:MULTISPECIES: hypothetical protein [unclassified Synechococcus]AII45022.1 hypothetical protein KR49_00905 [Synechococcus sp. KORDI-49]